MATATIRIKKGTTAEWTESHRVLDDGELGLELTADGHRILRVGNGSTEFMNLPVSFDIEEVRAIKTGMDDDAETYYNDMVEKGMELIAEMKAVAATVELEDDATEIKYRMGLSGGTMYFEEIKKETIVPDAGGNTEDNETGGGPGDSETGGDLEQSGETENTEQEESE